ncbi:MAG: AraC family transcriptional regulator [Oscillospiraceae bacterium]|nr:AraC family transcriptional regulator [Oscillospiraceae bacterium]
MENNLMYIVRAVDYIEAHLEDSLDLGRIAQEMGYSKYHLHRMFTSVVGLTVHSYVQRRRLTEAARLLIFSEQSIMEIALSAGYETQQSFSVAFKALFRRSPQVFRKKHEFYPFQLKYSVDGNKQLRGDRIMDIRTVEGSQILLVGYMANTKRGFGVIGKCWRNLHTHKGNIEHRTDMNFLVGLNDYSVNFFYENDQPAFDYYATVEVSEVSHIPKGMRMKELPMSKYMVFSFRGKTKDSLQPVVDYIYKEWFPQSTCQLNENARYDFARYGEAADKDGSSDIEYWVPIL